LAAETALGTGRDRFAGHLAAKLVAVAIAVVGAGAVGIDFAVPPAN
jgi:hypothetical protein